MIRFELLCKIVDMSSETPKELEYFISAKPPFLVVSFNGALARTSGEVFERCHEEILASGAKLVILSFHDVAGIERPIIPVLVKFQKALRDAKLSIRLCYLRPEYRKLLVDMGAIRAEEIDDNLKDALAKMASLAVSGDGQS